MAAMMENALQPGSSGIKLDFAFLDLGLKRGDSDLEGCLPYVKRGSGTPAIGPHTIFLASS